MENRCDQFALLAVRTCDADVPLKFPLAPIRVPCRPCTIAAGGILVVACAEELGGELRGVLSGDAVHLDLHADGLVLHLLDLCLGFCRHGVTLRASIVGYMIP